MVVLLSRATRMLLILFLAVLTVLFVIGIGRPETGILETLVLLGLIAGCVFLAAKVTTLAAVLRERFIRH